MVAKFFHKKSKRSSAKTYRKVEKRVTAHNRKKRRELKKNPLLRCFKRRKDPGIPKQMPFHDDVVKEVEAVKKRFKETKADIRRQLRENKQSRTESATTAASLEELVASAGKRDNDFDLNKLAGVGEVGTTVAVRKLAAEQARSSSLQKVIADSDVVLHVLDARDPIGTRSTAVSDMANNKSNCQVILVLNKIDLVPKANLRQWLAFLRKDLPTVAVRCAAVGPRPVKGGKKKWNLRESRQQRRSEKCIGLDLLLPTIDGVAARLADKKTVRVGIVGMPNVGKSSFVAALKRRAKGGKKCAAPLEFRLGEKLIVLERVGDIAVPADSTYKLCSMRRMFDLPNPISACRYIMERCDKSKISLFYEIPDSFKSPKEMLTLLAHRFGYKRKHAIADTIKAARLVLTDWSMGKLLHYRLLPAVESLPGSTESAASHTLTAGDAAAELELLGELNDRAEKRYFAIGDGPLDDAMVGSGDESDSSTGPVKTTKKKKIAVDLEDVSDSDDDAVDHVLGNQKDGKRHRVAIRKRRKVRRKIGVQADALADSLEAALTTVSTE